MPRRTSSITVTIPPEMAAQRLDKVLTVLLAEKIPALSRARLQALLAGEHVTLAKKAATDASRKVKEGEVYTVTVPPAEPAEPKAQAMKLTVVYEDKDLLVIDKPPGMVVHPAPGNRDRTLVNALLAHCGKSLSGIGGVARPGIVHRLDKDTSGLIVVAKNDTAHQALSVQFADRTLSRTYQALVWGEPVPRAGKIDVPIGRHARDRKKMAVTAKGKSALTYYKVIETFNPNVTPAKAGAPFSVRRQKPNGMPAFAGMTVSLIECKLATGRTHQIRVHLAHIKHPVVGDPVYGKQGGRKIDFPRQALHAAQLQFVHPRTGKRVSLSANLPKDMALLLKRLRAKSQ